MVLTSFAFTVGQFWIAAQNWCRQRAARSPTIRASRRSTTSPSAAALVFRYPGRARTVRAGALGETTFVAYSQKCTHLSCAVIPRPEEGVSTAPVTKDWFDLRTGGPWRARRARPLPRIVLEIRGRDDLRDRRRVENDLTCRSAARSRREQRTTIVYGMLAFVLIVVDPAALAADRDDERVARRRRVGGLAGGGGERRRIVAEHRLASPPWTARAPTKRRWVGAILARCPMRVRPRWRIPVCSTP